MDHRLIPWYKKLNLFWWIQNDDDGNCGNSWFFNTICKKQCNFKCKLKWFLRNPLHNFTFYVIGFGDRETISLYNDDVFLKGKSGWLFNIVKVSYEYFNIYLPYVSYINYNNHLQFYIGWRPNGQFGIKLRFW